MIPGVVFRHHDLSDLIVSNQNLKLSFLLQALVLLVLLHGHKAKTSWRPTSQSQYKRSHAHDWEDSATEPPECTTMNDHPHSLEAIRWRLHSKVYIAEITRWSLDGGCYTRELETLKSYISTNPYHSGLIKPFKSPAGHPSLSSLSCRMLETSTDRRAEFAYP